MWKLWEKKKTIARAAEFGTDGLNKTKLSGTNKLVKFMYVAVSSIPFKSNSGAVRNHEQAFVVTILINISGETVFNTELLIQIKHYECVCSISEHNAWNWIIGNQHLLKQPSWSNSESRWIIHCACTHSLNKMHALLLLHDVDRIYETKLARNAI